MPRITKATTELDFEQGVVHFHFVDGSTLSFAVNTLPDSIRAHLLLYGLEQKIKDAYAVAETPIAARELAKMSYALLRDGHWTKRAPRAPRESALEVLYRAVCNVLQTAGKSVPADLFNKLAAMSRGERAKLRSEPRIAAEIARLQGRESILDKLL